MTEELQLCFSDCRKGGPALRMTPEKMYSKHDTKNRAVFSEFFIFGFLCLTFGGIYLFMRCQRAALYWQRELEASSYQGCFFTTRKATVCKRRQRTICPNSGTRIFLDTKFAVGRFLERVG